MFLWEYVCVTLCVHILSWEEQHNLEPHFVKFLIGHSSSLLQLLHSIHFHLQIAEKSSSPMISLKHCVPVLISCVDQKSNYLTLMKSKLSPYLFYEIDALAEEVDARRFSAWGNRRRMKSHLLRYQKILYQTLCHNCGENYLRICLVSWGNPGGRYKSKRKLV